MYDNFDYPDPYMDINEDFFGNIDEVRSNLLIDLESKTRGVLMLRLRNQILVSRYEMSNSEISNLSKEERFPKSNSVGSKA